MDERTERMYELMRKESNRLKTFQMYPPWPKDYVDIKKLAKAGFFYAFNGDNVHCAFCRGQVCRWDRDDDPMTEHSRHFTTCPFIMGGEVGNEPIGEDPIPGPKRPRPFDVCGTHPNFPPDDPRNELDQQNQQRQPQPNISTQSPHTQNDPQQPQLAPLQQHQHVQLQRNQQPAVTSPFQAHLHSQSHQLMMQPGQYAAILQPPPIELPAIETQAQTKERLSYLMYQDLRNQELRNHQQQLLSRVGANQNQSSDQPSDNLNGICKICYTNPIELVFLPCGHSVSCISCSTRLNDCPFCRERICTRIRTYLV